MRMVCRYQKPICFIVLVSFYWLCLPQLSAQAAMITTEDTLDGGSKTDFDRARITLIAGKLDQLPAGGVLGEAIALYAFIAAVILAVIFMIIAYALDEGPSKPTYREF